MSDATTKTSDSLLITCKRREYQHNTDRIRKLTQEYYQIIAHIGELEKAQGSLIAEISALEQLELPFA